MNMAKMTEAQRKAKQREYHKKYYQEHKEAIKASQRKYMENVSDDVLERQKTAQKEWFETNKSYRAEYMRKYRDRKKAE